jgi:signal transduction histidine kinase/AraC-like DNA-binding protein
MGKFAFRLTAWVGLLGVFCGCLHQPSPQKYRIGFSQCCDDAWRDVMNREMLRELAFHPELDLHMRVADGNSEQQIAQIRALVASGIDLLIVAPNESQPLTAVIGEVYKKGIPVILIDRKTNSEQYTAYLGGDNYEIGQTAARYIANQLGGKAKILELQMWMTISPAIERDRGFRDGIRSFPGMEIVGSVEVEGPIENDLDSLTYLLKNHPEATVVFGHTDLLAETAWKEAQKLGLADHMFFVGVDGIPGTGQGIQAVEDGILDASLLYPTGGAEAIKLAFTILHGLPFEKTNRLQTTVINPGNAAILHSQMKKEASLQESIDKQIKAVDELKGIYRDQRIFIIVLISSLLLSIFLGAVLWKSLQAKQTANRNLEIKNREVLEHEQQIVAMSDELQQATQVKVDFFTNISHEFRTPLTLILGYLEGLLATGATGKEAKQDLGMVRKNALRLLRLVNQLMDFRKIESGKMAVRASENDLVGFAKEIAETYRKVAAKRNIQFDFAAAEPTLSVWFDANMLDKVLFNLLSNAFKFTPEGGRIQVGIAVDRIAGKAVVKVEDTGRGMSPEHTAHAFERFYQESNASKTRGTGLGLSLSKELVALHGGSIELRSERGRGSCFEVSLPLGYAHFREDQLAQEKIEGLSYDEEMLFFEEENPSPPVVLTTEKNAEQTLLLIEDNDDMRLFLKKQFGKNYHIREATDGNLGLHFAVEEVPDLIIADISMPGRDGLDTDQNSKTDLRTSHIPIVLLTARNTMEQKIEGIQTGADAYVTKPFNLVFLSEIVKNLLQGRENLRERFGGNLQPGKLPSGIGDLDQQFLRKFSAHVEANFADQNLTVERLSEEFGLSRVQLFRKTKALLGDSPNDFIQHIRLKKAGQLLRESQLAVAEIAYQTGYSSPGYFATAFRGKYGVSPSEWREGKGV